MIGEFLAAENARVQQIAALSAAARAKFREAERLFGRAARLCRLAEMVPPAPCNWLRARATVLADRARRAMREGGEHRARREKA